MTYLKCCAAALPLLATLAFAAPASAWCGAIEQSATSHNVQKANFRANRAVDKQVRKLRRENGRKLVLSERQSACVGGALAIDANGTEIVGPSRCTVTQPFCVNP